MCDSADDRGGADTDRELLVDHLRFTAGRMTVHASCGIGVCGACTVLIDRGPIRSCLALTAEIPASQVRTLEDVRDTVVGERVREAFAEHHALQCGYCTPGFMLLAIAMIESGRLQSRGTITELMSDNICRCTGYETIAAAFADLARTSGLWGDCEPDNDPRA